MTKKKRYVMLVSEEQDMILKERKEVFGFAKKSDYIRFMIFMDSFIEKIDDIHREVCSKNAGKNGKKD
mgnify:CR=1 FL=1